MVQKVHGILEDVGSAIGFTATSLLVDWFGGIGQLYIPSEVKEDHPITKVIGVPAMKQLVKLYEGAEPHERFVWLNQNEQRDAARRDRLIAALFFLGLGGKQIAVLTGMSERHVFLARQRVEQLGILPMILRRAGVNQLMIATMEDYSENRPEKTTPENQVENPGEKPGAKATSNTQPTATSTTTLDKGMGAMVRLARVKKPPLKKARKPKRGW